MLRPVKPTAAQIKLEQAQRAYAEALGISEEEAAKRRIAQREIIERNRIKKGGEK